MKKSLKGGVLFLLFFAFFLSQYLYAQKTVYVGIYDNPPLSYMDDTSNPKGLFPSILNVIAKENNLNLVYKKCQWEQCLKMLSVGSINILSPIARTKTREKKYLFADENVLTNYGVIYTLKDTNINFWTDLNHKKVALLKGDIHAKFFWNYIKNFKIDVSVVYFESYKAMFKLLSQKKLDAIVSNSIIFLKYQKKFPNVKKTNIVLDEIPITFAYNKKNISLKKSIDKSLKNYKINIDSTYYKLLHKYLNIKVEERPYLKYVFIAFLILTILLILLFLINQILHTMVKKATKIINEKYEKELYLNKIINTVKNVNQILLIDAKPKEKISLVCEKIIEGGLYKAAYIGIIKDNKLEIITSSKNFPKDYSYKLDLEKEKNSPIAKAILMKKTLAEPFLKDKCFFNDIFDTTSLTFVLSVPIICQNSKLVYGALTVYTSNKLGFKQKEISLIEELSGDISLFLSAEYLKKKNLAFYIERTKNYKEMVFSLNKAIEARDPYTAGHSKRVSQYAALIAKKMELNKEQITILQKAGELHDIGKIETPDSILLKPGALNEYEYNIIKKHPQKGYEILSNISFLKEEAEVILHHHERYDGSGYPNGLKKDEIPLLSQILSIADIFDAMTTNRIYKPAKSKEAALKEIESLTNIWFGKSLVEYTLKALKEVELQKEYTFFTQAPKDPLEEARFVYFFKDHLSECYNKDYLQHLYINKEIENYSYIYTFAINNFTNYNKLYSWDAGDEFLIKISKTLQKSYTSCKIFRVKGDDFLIISKDRLNLDKPLADIFDMQDIISYKTEMYEVKDINSIDKLKELIRMI